MSAYVLLGVQISPWEPKAAPTSPPSSGVVLNDLPSGAHGHDGDRRRSRQKRRTQPVSGKRAKRKAHADDEMGYAVVVVALEPKALVISRRALFQRCNERRCCA